MGWAGVFIKFDKSAVVGEARCLQLSLVALYSHLTVSPQTGERLLPQV